MRTGTEESYVLRQNYAPLFVGVDGCVTLAVSPASEREQPDVLKAVESRSLMDNYRNTIKGANGKGRVVDVRV